jgi:hypothetical protein
MFMIMPQSVHAWFTSIVYAKPRNRMILLLTVQHAVEESADKFVIEFIFHNMITVTI